MPMAYLLSTAAAGLGLLASAFAAPATTGSIALASGKSLFTFDYVTPQAHAKNWIGIYNIYSGGPEKEKFVSPSITWEYAPATEGGVHIPAAKLQPGSYKAYFLAEDGYRWLARPVSFVVAGKGALAFTVDQFTTRNGRVGDGFRASISGLLANPPDAKTSFSKVSGPAWVRVSADGTLSGIPDAAGTSRVTVRATATDGSQASLEATIPVRKYGTPLVDRLGALSFNLWHGGTQVSDYHRKQVQFIVSTGVDVVGFQESTGGHAIRLAQALGWDVYQGNDVGIISRYPIVQVYPDMWVAGAVRISLDGENRQVIVWNVHLGYTPYGPYDFCFDKMSWERVLRRETESGRTPQIRDVLGRMKTQLSNTSRVPIILLGDFNAPSHLDWTDDTRGQHCGVGLTPWPTSIEPFKLGLVDSFREIHPDPARVPGNTWSPVYLDNAGRREPLDRIDFIYHKGLTVVDSQVLVVGKPAPQPNHRHNEWTTDHAAVKSVFQLGKE
ncbi:exonuclease III [Drechmeria coniospora]|uniref:Exonuclease III n=1 Tax=Drechmeria coniospora TaxID=98403 RepID=A0A151GBB7_DRECN|nr:exonuclease III [Drechmeria coniospora]KYK54416.1 exonuclease III [Drechmeria coniospora]ODA77300.1 hypothetical protein RJ55_06927 [Drechmeria coniospora]